MITILQDNRLRQKYKGLPRSVSDIKEITLHGTGGGSSSIAIINWMQSDTCERAENYKKAIGLFPYSINFDGVIYNLMPVLDWYYHSDAGQYDKHTIGIELLNIGINNSGSYTEKQYDSLYTLIDELISVYPTIDTISSHDYNRRIYSGLPPKPCPSDRFDWSQLEEFVADSIDKTITINRS